MHARQQIFAYVATTLQATAAKVEVQTPYDVERKHKSHINIEFSSDTVNLERKTLDCDARDMDMILTVTAKGGALGTGGPEADSIAEAVEVALSSADGQGTHTVTAAVVEIDHDNTDNADADDMEESVAVLYMSFSVFYRIAPGNPALLV